MERRTARVRLRMEPLMHLLDLPAGARVLAIEQRQDPVGFDLIIEHRDLPVVPDDAESPVLVAEVEKSVGSRYLYRWRLPDGTLSEGCTCEPGASYCSVHDLTCICPRTEDGERDFETDEIVDCPMHGGTR